MLFASVPRRARRRHCCWCVGLWRGWSCVRLCSLPPPAPRLPAATAAHHRAIDGCICLAHLTFVSPARSARLRAGLLLLPLLGLLVLWPRALLLLTLGGCGCGGDLLVLLLRAAAVGHLIFFFFFFGASELHERSQQQNPHPSKGPARGRTQPGKRRPVEGAALTSTTRLERAARSGAPAVSRVQGPVVHLQRKQKLPAGQA
jgi:hypothetical protein